MRTLVIVNSTHTVPFRRVNRAVFQALQHFGVWYETIDHGWVRISEEELRNVSLLIIGQEGIGKNFSNEEFSIILRRVQQGMGLVIFDGFLSGYPSIFLKTMGMEQPAGTMTSSVKILAESWMGRHQPFHDVPFKQPVPCYPVDMKAGIWRPLLLSDTNLPAAVFGRLGRGKIILFCLSAGVWQDEYLGHAEGLDGIFWRSLAWAAQKPFVMKTMPPFVTGRIDDVSAGGSPVASAPETVRRLHWLEELNRGGFRPHLGVFLDDIGTEDSVVIRQKFIEGLAEFSPHAFKDPRNRNEFPIYMNHDGTDFNPAVLKKNFERVDQRLAAWGIRPSKTVNAHFGEIGLAALPHLKERGQTHLMNVCRVGKAYADPKSRAWDLRPYGKIHFSLDFIPEDPAFFNVMSAPGTYGVSDKPDFDFLFGCTTFGKENPSLDCGKAVRQAMRSIRSGLQNRFFGCLLTHEQRISHIRPEEWEQITGEIAGELKGIPHMMKRHDEISSYAENRARCEIVNAEYTNELIVRMKGETRTPIFISLFSDEGDTVRESFLEIPPFEKTAEMNFKI